MWLNLPAVLLVTTGPACWAILQGVRGVTLGWNLVLVPAAVLGTLASLVVPTPGDWLVFLSLRIVALEALVIWFYCLAPYMSA